MMPNFIIIGARKAGTTFLYQSLRQHPDIYMSPYKEPSYFALNDCDHTMLTHCSGGQIKARSRLCFTREQYERQFNGHRGEKAVGEASPIYLYKTGTAAKIKNSLPKARVIAILRNPVDRAFSAYLNARRDNIEPVPDFAKAVSLETERLGRNTSYMYAYIDGGMYYRQLKEYYDVFDKKQIKVVLYDDLLRNRNALLKEIFRFLDVDDSFVPQLISHYNKSGTPRNKILHAILSIIYFRNEAVKYLPRRLRYSRSAARLKGKIIAAYNGNLDDIKLSDRDRLNIQPRFAEDIRKLGKLTAMDLRSWLE